MVEPKPRLFSCSSRTYNALTNPTKSNSSPEFVHPYLFGLTEIIFRIPQGYIVLQMMLQNVKHVLICIALSGDRITVSKILQECLRSHNIQAGDI